MAGCSRLGGLGTSLVRLELLVLGMGGEPLRDQEEGRRRRKIRIYTDRLSHLLKILIPSNINNVRD